MQETDSSLEDSFSESLSYEYNLLSPPKLEEYLRAIRPTGFPCLCGRKIPSFLIRSHLPACLHHLSILLNEVPLCTCLQCKGKRTHPGDKLSDKGRESEQQTEVNCNSNKSKKKPGVRTWSQVEEDAEEMPTLEDLTPAHILGRICIICGDSKAQAKGLPYINLGQYRRFRLCGKTHVAQSGVKIAKLVDLLANNIRTNGDTALDHDVIVKGAPAKVFPSPSTEPCKGYERLVPLVPCTKKNIDHVIWLQEKGETGKRFFCCGEHVIRYLTHHYLAQNKNSKEKREEKSS
jgi:hypothetical protein